MSKDSVSRNNIWKWLVLVLVASISFYVCNPPKEKFRFGLDLKGGTSFTLGVDKEKLIQQIVAENPAILRQPSKKKLKKSLQVATIASFRLFAAVWMRWERTSLSSKG